MKIEELQSRKKMINEFINNDEFYTYDLKNEMDKSYNKIEETCYCPKDEKRKKDWYEIKAFDKYVEKIEYAKKQINSLPYEVRKIDENNFPNLKKYLLYRYQAKLSRNYFDCDKSFLVYEFYKNKLKNYPELNHLISISLSYYTPQYFDTYFSVQSLWGKLINNLKYDEFKNYNESLYIGSDFKWQLEHFDNIVKIPELNELLNAFDEFCYLYHTVGNIAPCAPGINSPKGLAGCFDRLDLFIEKINKDWFKWYFDKEPKLLVDNFSSITKVLCLEEFLNPKNLKEVRIPKNKDDTENIKYLTEYINEIVRIIKDRIKKLKN